MDNRILDDLAKVAAGALGGVSGVRQEIEARLRQQFERVLANMEVVTARNSKSSGPWPPRRGPNKRGWPPEWRRWRNG